MSARRETYRILSTPEGWLVQTNAQGHPSGPYVDQERAIAGVLAAVRDGRPSRLRIRNVTGVWQADVVYEPAGAAAGGAASAAAASSRKGSAAPALGNQGVPHVSS